MKKTRFLSLRFGCYVWHLSRDRSSLPIKELVMLVLSRKCGEKIVIGDNIIVTVVDIRGDKVRVGIEAPKGISIHREEVYKESQRDKLSQ